MIRLYLHSDLCKAEGEPEVKKVAAGRAAGLSDPLMRVRQTSHKKTAGMQRRVQREERAYHTTAENKPPYKCIGKDCGAHVMPPKKEKLHGPLHPEERKAREAKGQDISEHSEGGVAIHPPKMISGQGKPVKLGHGDVTSEMLPHRAGGKQMGGYCPGCHAARQQKTTVARTVGKNPDEASAKMEKLQGETKKALDLLDEMQMIKSNEVHKSISLILAL